MTTLERSPQRNQMPDLDQCRAARRSADQNYDAIERILDAQAIAYEHMPHNICGAALIAAWRTCLFLRWRFGAPA
jgi:hypothetical protein